MLIPLIRQLFFASVLALPVAPAVAMIALEDEELSEQTGAAITIGWQNLRFLAGPTTYLEAIGESSTPFPAPWKRVDLRWYGFGYSGVTPVSAYAGTCSAGYAGMGCPIGDTVPYFMSFDNPLMIRVFDYTAIRFGGTSLTQTVFEFLAPTNSSPFRYSWWADMLIDQNTSTRLQGQAVSNNVRLSTVENGVRNNMKIRIVRHTDAMDPTIGFIFENHWSGDFRYSVNQAFYSADTHGVPPAFTSFEGFYALNVKSFWPLGQLHYQSLVVDDVSTDLGNFRWTVTTPTAAGAYNNFYAVATGDTLGYTRRSAATGLIAKPSNAALTLANWYRTHAYINFGDWWPNVSHYAFPNNGGATPPANPNHWLDSGLAACSGATTVTNGTGCNGRYSTSDGMFFVSYDPSGGGNPPNPGGVNQSIGDYRPGAYTAYTGARFYAYSDTLNAADYSGGANDRYGVARTNNPWDGPTNMVNLGDGRVYGVLVNKIKLETTGL